MRLAPRRSRARAGRPTAESDAAKSAAQEPEPYGALGPRVTAGLHAAVT